MRFLSYRQNLTCFPDHLKFAVIKAFNRTYIKPVGLIANKYQLAGKAIFLSRRIDREPVLMVRASEKIRKEKKPLSGID